MDARRGRRRRPRAADGGGGPAQDAAGARRARDVSASRCIAAAVSGRRLRPRHAREHDPVLRRARPGHRARRLGRVLVLDGAGDADLVRLRLLEGDRSWMFVA